MSDNQQLGPIRPDELYPVSVLKERLGWKETALRSARRDGLKVKRYGNLYFVLGSDVVEFLRRVETTDRNTTSRSSAATPERL